MRFWSPTALLFGLVSLSELLAWAFTLRDSALAIAFPSVM